MKIIKYDKEKLTEVVKNSVSFKAVALKLGYRGSGGATITIKKYVSLWEIDTSHFLSPAEIKKILNISKIKQPIEAYLKKGTQISSYRLKEKLYKEQIKFPICEICGQDNNWNNSTLVLILDHINGINNDNRLENLRIVCPNCNSQLPTFGSKNRIKVEVTKTCPCGQTIKSRNKYCSSFCMRTLKKNSPRKVERPSYNQLIEDINSLSMVAVGKKYGVSDNAIRKWIRYYQKQQFLSIH